MTVLEESPDVLSPPDNITSLAKMEATKATKVTRSLKKLLTPLRKPIESERRVEADFPLMTTETLEAAEEEKAMTTRIRTRNQEEVALEARDQEVEVAAVAAEAVVMALAVMARMDKSSIVTS